MHVSYVILGIGFIVNKIKIGKRNAKIITILFLLFFMILTGVSPSVERACIMSIYMIVGSILNKRCKSIYSLSFSMIVILLFNPYNIKDVGLLLSFLGTLGIIVFYPIFNKKIEKKRDSFFEKIKIKIIQIILVTISANIMIFPIVLFNFNTLSTVFLISNILVSPIIGIIVFLGFITLFIFGNFSCAKFFSC